MRNNRIYKTRQREAIMEYLLSLKGEHVTADEIYQYFQQRRISVGLTTIYRNLDRMVDEGLVKKFNIEGISKACFQFLDKEMNRDEHLHLICENCGELIHLECRFVEKLSQHMASEHSFILKPEKSIFYGLCESCIKTAKK